MNKLKKYLAYCCFTLSSFVFASTPTVPSAPTSSSKPLPTIETVRNIDLVITETVQSKIEKSASLKGQSVTAVSHGQIITLEGSLKQSSKKTMLLT